MGENSSLFVHVIMFFVLITCMTNITAIILMFNESYKLHSGTNNNNALDKSKDLDWKRATLAVMIDTACAAPGEHRTRCATMYDHRKTCERGVQLWTSLARAAGWSYDPWAMAASDVLLDRLGKWVAHPGYHGAC